MSSDSQLKEYRDAFKLFDKKGSDAIPIESLGDLLRALGQNPTQADVAKLAKGVGKSELDFDKFLQILKRPGGFDPVGTYEELIEGFAIFDKKKTGYIPVQEMRYVLTNLGEKLSAAEADELLKDFQVTDGNINYQEFTKKMLAS